MTIRGIRRNKLRTKVGNRDLVYAWAKYQSTKVRNMENSIDIYVEGR